MRLFNRIPIFTIFCALLLLSACGGGGGDSAVVNTDGGETPTGVWDQSDWDNATWDN